jgi:hypothetical protein
VHIPKTAGTTFIEILKLNFQDRFIFQIDGLNPEKSFEELQSLEKESLDRIELVMGHGSISAEPFFSSKEITRILFLRDPIRHFLSTYHYIKKTKVHKQYRQANTLSLAEFLDFRIENRQNNLQTQHLAGVATNMVKGVVDFKVKGQEIYLNALRELEKTKYIFLTENFDEALAILKLNGVIKHTSYSLKNVSISEDDPLKQIDSALLDKIRASNSFDVQLYREATFRYQQLLSSIRIDNTVKKIKLKNSIRRFFNFY